MEHNKHYLKSIFILLLCIYSGLNAQAAKQQESSIITTSGTQTNNNNPVITKWMMTTFIVAGSVITFWALCICALACILLRLYIKRRTKVTKGDPVRNNSNKSLNDSSDSDDISVKETNDNNIKEPGDETNDITNNNDKQIITRKPTTTKRYSFREITMNHCVLQNSYNSAPTTTNSVPTNSVPTNSANHFQCKPQLSHLSPKLSNDSHPIGHGGEYYHPQPPSVDINTLKQLMHNAQFSNDSSLDTIMNINKSKVIDSETEEINMQIMEEMDGEINIDESRASDDDIYIKPKSGDNQTPTLGLMITPNGNDITPNGCSDDDESKDGFPDTGLIADAQHIHTQSINMEETHDRDGSQYTYSYTQTGQTDLNLNMNKPNNNNNKQNPPPTVMSDHSIYPSIPSIAIPNGPSSHSTAPIAQRDIMPSSFSAIYEKCVTPDGLNMYNTTTTDVTTNNNNNYNNNNNIPIHSILQQPTNGPSIFKSLTQQSKTATPTYQLPKYNVTKGQWM